MDASRGVLSGTMDKFKMVCRLFNHIWLLKECLFTVFLSLSICCLLLPFIVVWEEEEGQSAYSCLFQWLGSDLAGIRDQIQPENVHACSILCCALSYNILPH